MLLNSSIYYTIFYPTTELVILIGIPNKEAKTETEIHPVNVEVAISECSI